MSATPKRNRAVNANSELEQEGNGLPEGWAEAPLDGLVYLAGRIGWRGLTAAEYTPSGPMFLSVPNLNHGDDVDFTVVNHISQERYDESPEIKLQNNDILLTKDGAGIGKLGFVKELRSPATVNSSLLVIRAREAFEPKYLFYCLKAPEFQGLAQERITGSTTPHLFQKDIKTLRVRIAPLPEQRRIVAKLEQLLSKVSSSQKRLSRVPGLLKRFRQSVLAAACSGKLTADWREENAEPAWMQARADEVCEAVQSGSTPKSNLFQPETGVPFLKVYNIVNQSVAFEYRSQFVSEMTHQTTLKRAIALPGDVLMNIVGPPLGKVAIVPNDYPRWSINQAIVLFRPRPQLDRKFLYYVLCSGLPYAEILSETRGSAGQSNISLSQCREMILPLPPLSEQLEIVRRVEQLFAFADQIEVRLTCAQSHVDRLTHSILAKAFRGALVPTEAELAAGRPGG